MPSFKRLTAAAAVAASLSVAGTAAPASASDADLDGIYCGGQISVPSCVNWTFDTTQATIERGRWTYNNQVQPILDNGACAAYEIITGEPCPTRGMVPKI